MAALDVEFHALTTELILRKIKEGPARLLQAHRMYVDAIRRRDLDRPIDRIDLQNR